ncbi:MAG: hypothetical protein KUG77_02780 [Nannocystaceae bacterium]|nr:hypothetical protein [Nannocystaceae bacterium]
MKRIAARIVCASLLLGGCSSSGGPIGDEEQIAERLIGGWDGASTTGTSVLLLREGLSGTLSAAHLFGTDREFQVNFSVTGSMAEDDKSVLLDLACAEGRVRSLTAEPDDEDDTTIPSATDEEPSEDSETDPDGWDSLDCAGWALQLECGIAGECDTADCNLFCDVSYFGDAFATATIELSSIEDELDHWQRV